MKPAAQRVKELRERRKSEGLRRVEYWLSEADKIEVDVFVDLLSNARSNRPDSDSDTSHSTK